MFTIYNETPNALELINLNTDKMVILKKPIMISDKYSKSIDIKLSKKIIFDNAIGVVKMHNKLNSMIMMSEPDIMIEQEVSTIFNRTDFSPFILSTKSDKAIGIISIDLTNKKLIGINKTSCFVFESIITKNELSLFVSINKIESPLVISIYDNSIDKVIKYTFSNVNGQILMNRSVSDVSDRKMLNIKLSNRYTITKFRPARSTYNILTISGVELPEIIKSGSYKITNFDAVNQSIDCVCNELVLSKVSAVTIYTEGLNPKELNKTIDRVCNYMNIVYLMDSNAKIKRQKLN